MTSQLDLVAELVEAETGIHTRDAQMPSLEAALARVSPGMNAQRFLAALRQPTAAAALLGRLIDEVAVQETYFIRDRSELEAIDWPALVASAHRRGDQGVSVWVCACASGEEAYSVAMLAMDAFDGEPPPVSILGSDVSGRALERAQRGLYSERSTREIDAVRRERFFGERGHKLEVGEELRSIVSWRRHNLVADPAPPQGFGPFDLILCRNVLMYFRAANVEVATRSLEAALRPEGQLILGASDRLTSSARRFAELAARHGDVPPAARRSIARRAKDRPRQPRTRGAGAGTPKTSDARPGAPRPEVSDAQSAANKGDYNGAIEMTRVILRHDPLDAEAHFVRGLAELAAHKPAAAAESLRRALYIDPSFALAAFQLGRAQDICGDPRAAVRAYRHALSTLDPEDNRHPHLLEPGDIADIAAACRTRLRKGDGFERASGGVPARPSASL